MSVKPAFGVSLSVLGCQRCARAWPIPLSPITSRGCYSAGPSVVGGGGFNGLPQGWDHLYVRGQDGLLSPGVFCDSSNLVSEKGTAF